MWAGAEDRSRAASPSSSNIHNQIFREFPPAAQPCSRLPGLEANQNGHGGHGSAQSFANGANGSLTPCTGKV